MSKYSIPFETAWIIRSPSLNDPKLYLFHVVANEWNYSPTCATIYRSEESAIRMINDMRHYDRVGFSKGVIIEAVPFEGAALALGKHLNLKDLKS